MFEVIFTPTDERFRVFDVNGTHFLVWMVPEGSSDPTWVYLPMEQCTPIDQTVSNAAVKK